MSADHRPYPDYKAVADQDLFDRSLPTHWKHMALKRMLWFGNGRDHKNIEVDEDGYPVFGSGGPFARASEYLHEGESVLFGRKGTVDRPLYLNCRFWTVDTMYFTRINNDACARYIYYVALGIPYSLYSTNTALPSMTQEVLGNHKVPAPPLQEQIQISKFLDHETTKIDALIEKQQKLIALLKEKRQAVISHAVTKGLNPDAPMRDSGIEWLGEVPAHWDVKRLKYSCDLESGHTPSKTQDSYWIEEECKIPWVSLNDTKTLDAEDYISETAVMISEKGLANSSAHRIPSGAVVFNRDGARVGLAAITTKEMCVSQHIIAWVCGPEMLNEYLLHVIYAMRQEIYRVTWGSTIPTIGMGDIRQMTCPAPPLSEQQEIVDQLVSVRTRLQVAETNAHRTIELLQERRAALISAAVTGKIDVRDWKAPESEFESEAEVA